MQRAFEQLAGSPNAAKAQGTLRSRQQHFLDWCNKLSIDHTFTGIPVSDRNYILALYALYLAQGNTIQYLAIRSSTIDRYLLAAAKLSTAAHQMDPRLDIHGKKSAQILKVINEQKRWEEMPKRREPVTVAMIKDLESNSNPTG